jgi:hypothetical protein
MQDPVLAFRQAFGVFARAGVIALLQPSVGWAAETTVRGVSAGIYAGAGGLLQPDNESGVGQYDVKRLGAGVLGVWRLDRPRLADREQQPGFFAAWGASFELEASLRTGCGAFDCFLQTQTNKSYLAKHVATRLGAGYSLPVFEFRVGALAALPDANVSYAEPLVMPDVMLRIGPRSFGWFELGLGAYDASTNLRPGLYLGGAVGPEQQLRISAHFGLHFVNGLCCSTVVSAGYRIELAGSRALSDSVSVGLGIALLGASASYADRSVTEGSARIAIAY